jgi:hypothetical protein
MLQGLLTTRIIQRCIDVLIGRMNANCDTSPSSSSPNSIRVRYSCDTRISERSKTKMGWWFEGLSSLSMYLMERTVKTMIAHKMDNWVINRFLWHYLKPSFPMLGYNSISPQEEMWEVRADYVRLYPESAEGDSGNCCEFFFILWREESWITYSFLHPRG